MEASDRRALWLLALGCAAGIGLAAFGIARSGELASGAPEGAIALVNGMPISRDAFARFAGAVAAERKQLELDPDTRRRLLERMIEEELLFQRGLALGLERHEPSARRAVVAAMIASLGADADLSEPDEASLRSFYEENAERFTRADRLELDVAFVAVAGRPDALAFRNAEQIATRARSGEPFERLREELADEPVAPLPGGALAFETLRRYLGPTAAQAAQRLAPGEVGEPVRGGDGYYVLALRGSERGERPPFAEVRRQVRSEYLRHRSDQRLRDYVTALRESGEIRVLDPELQ